MLFSSPAASAISTNLSGVVPKPINVGSVSYYDGLGQVMPVRDGGERIAFGHAQRTPPYLFCLFGV